jgi:pyrophosphate--fructose-6-phosphate 1-phosphotransferase
MPNCSPLQEQRLSYQPKLPQQLYNLRQLILAPDSATTHQLPAEITSFFPHLSQLQPLTLKHRSPQAHTPKRVGILLSGGQAAGGHNVIVGVFDALMQLHPESRLFGFLGGPSGLIKNQFLPLTREIIQNYRNQGGFDMIGAGRTRISTPEDFKGVEATIDALQLDGIVIIGGDDSNTNAAILAEYLKSRDIHTNVIGVPKTIDGDLKNASIEASFGFDSACKTYSELIGNIARDALSAKKYYHIVKLMGRSASHIELECALQTQPNYTIIGEEIHANQYTFQKIINDLANLVCQRADAGKNYGVILLPEGIIEFIPEFAKLISELNQLLAPNHSSSSTTEGQDSQETELLPHLTRHLSESSAACLASLPSSIQQQLIGDRDPHGNVQVSKIETERLFITALETELARRKNQGSYKGKFNSQPHFLGYEGRSCFPSNFDCQYCYSLGHIAALLINSNASGYMCCIKHLAEPVETWQCGGIPLVQMMHLEMREGLHRPVIAKALVDLHGAPFQTFTKQRQNWMIEDHYRYPGPIQFGGLPAVTEAISLTLALEQKSALT